MERSSTALRTATICGTSITAFSRTVKLWRHWGDNGLLQLEIVALRAITEGEELFIDYALAIDESHAAESYPARAVRRLAEVPWPALISVAMPPVDSAPRVHFQPSVFASSPTGSKGSTTRCGPAGPARSRMRRWRADHQNTRSPAQAATHWSVRAVAKETGIAKSTVASPVPALRSWNLTAPATPSFLDRSLLHREGCAMSSAFISTRPTRPWCFASMRRARSRPSNAPSPCFSWGWATSKASPTTTSATAHTTLFAALNVLDGAVIAQCKPRHRHQEFLAFPRHVEANVPAQLDSPSRHRQLRYPQTSQGQSVTRLPSALAHSLHAHLCLLAQPSRTPSPSSPNAPFAASHPFPPPSTSGKSTASSAITTKPQPCSCRPQRRRRPPETRSTLSSNLWDTLTRGRLWRWWSADGSSRGPTDGHRGGHQSTRSPG